MPESEMPSPESQIPEGQPAQGKEEESFAPSFLVQLKEELSAISDEGLGRRIRLLHEAAKGKVLSPEDWRSEYLSIMRDTSRGIYPENESTNFLGRIGKYLEESTESQKGATAAQGKESRVEAEKEVPEEETFAYINKGIRDRILKIWDPETSPEEREKLKKEILDPGGLYDKRSALYERAEELGLFDDVRAGITNIVRKSTWNDAKDDIIAAANNLAANVEGRHEIDPRMRGMAKEAVIQAAHEISYRGFLRAKPPGGDWDPAWLAKHGQDRNSLERLRRSVDIFSFLRLDDHIEEYVELDLRTQKTEEMREAESREQMLLGVLVKIMEAQRQQGGPFDPEQFAKAIAREMGIPSAEDVETLYRLAEGGMAQIQIPVGQEPKFLIGRPEPEKERWRARAKLSTACGFRKDAPGYEKLHPNTFANEVSLQDLENLTNQKGAWEALCYYSAVIAGKGKKEGDEDEARDVGLNPKVAFLRKTGVSEELGKEREVLEKLSPESLFSIKSEEVFGVFRKSMRYWLKSELGLNNNEAQDAEQIAWNLIYLSNMVEQYDSRVYRPGVEDRIPPSVPTLKSLAFWMMIHPQERLEAKVGRSSEAWSVLGEWALNRLKRNPGSKIPDVLPLEAFKGVFAEIKEEGGRFLETRLVENGMKIFRGDLSSLPKPNWRELKETPFGGYYFETVSPAILMFKVIDSGEQKDKRLSQLGDALRKLKLTRKERENILMAWNGVNNTSFNLRPFQGWFRWNQYLSGVRADAPNFFRD